MCECADPPDSDLAQPESFPIYVHPLTWIRRPAPTHTLTGGGGGGGGGKSPGSGA
jgi:hypothetical protein